ncbi:hypothetical protein JX265_010137 [Neoarthrinium moseri]|uniref:Uncharacterized protein n=1 Tax=Neoarthrinium moseri TaxID=1658444 RepID=A0A9P9WF98_9PEZI|nr:hypothetical protein JX266_012562 [Neoarthrinium moseri]KAI1860213.1 hypothetical protein JX265_010137 [Neoarthrinium moseri]
MPSKRPKAVSLPIHEKPQEDAPSAPSGGGSVATQRRREQIRTSQRKFRERQRNRIDTLQTRVVGLETVLRNAVEQLKGLQDNPARDQASRTVSMLVDMLESKLRNGDVPLISTPAYESAVALIDEAHQLEEPASPASHRPISSPIHDALIDRFVDYLAPSVNYQMEHYWINNNRPRRSWRTGALLTPSPLLHNAYLAAATRFAGQTMDDSRLIQAADTLYSALLCQLQRAIGDPETSKSDAVLMATTLCLLYEGRLRRVSQNALGTHVFGALALFAQRGPKSCVSGIAHELYVEGRISWAWFSIMRRSPTFLSDQAWKTIPWSSHATFKDVMDYLLDCIVDIPELLAMVDQSKLENSPSNSPSHMQEHISSTAYTIIQNLHSWEQVWMKYILTNRVSEICVLEGELPTFRYLDRSTGRMIQPTVFMFQDAISFQALCHYYAALLVVSMVDYNSRKDESTGTVLLNDHCFEIACLFCRCMHYFMTHTPPSLVDRVIMPFKTVYEVLPPDGPERRYLDLVYMRKISQGFAASWHELKRNIGALRETA